MSWLYSQALVAAYLADTCSDGAVFAPSNGSPIPQAYLPPDRMTAFSRPSRFGMTFAPLTEDRGAELLTWFRADSRARTSAPPAKAPASTASDPACGAKWRELSVKYDRNSSSWKTHRCLWDEALPESSLTLPRWGSMRNGVLSELLTSALPTAANDAGLWATPAATDGTRGGTITENMTGVSLAQMVNTPARWPTPTASDHTGPGHVAQGGMNLRTAVVMWPTPTVCGNHNRKGASANSGDGLATAVRLWPTPVASMSKGSSPNSLTRKDGQDRSNDRLDHAVMAIDGGQLNPTWVEWLMGFPLGWTDCEHLATRSYRRSSK